MAIIAATIKLQSGFLKTAKEVFSQAKGSPTHAASFTDVASGAYYANAVAWANANGIVSGYGSGKFGPNDSITREQLAAILYRYATYKNYDVSKKGGLTQFSDISTLSSYATESMSWAVGSGIISGKGGGNLVPREGATRAEAAAILQRFCENTVK